MSSGMFAICSPGGFGRSKLGLMSGQSYTRALWNLVLFPFLADIAVVLFLVGSVSSLGWIIVRRLGGFAHLDPRYIRPGATAVALIYFAVVFLRAVLRHAHLSVPGSSQEEASRVGDDSTTT